jgi:heptosyltransferase III
MIKRILIIIQRSNGDVFFSLPLVNTLYEYYNFPQIDLLVNEDTTSLAKLLPNINHIHEFSYKKKRENQFKQERRLLVNIFQKYDLSINLTASDRSVIYALAAAKKSISAIEENNKKSWWKKILLSSYYYFNFDDHILINNSKSLNALNIQHELKQPALEVSSKVIRKVETFLKKISAKRFIIFHPSAQYKYKIYPEELRNELLRLLSSLGIAIIITGSKNSIDSEIKKNIPKIPNVYDFIGITSLEEYVALSHLSSAYIGMDTLNMHVAASQNKRIFAIFGPTLLHMWSPWSNYEKKSANINTPLQTYGEFTIFQANMPCVACGNAGCDNKNGNSDCLDNIDPKTIFLEIKSWYEEINLKL